MDKVPGKKVTTMKVRAEWRGIMTELEGSGDVRACRREGERERERERKRKRRYR
jgi:hypothetical protein